MSCIDAGETLKQQRAAAGLSQMALAVKVGVTLPAVSGWERNLYKPRRPTAQRLDDALRAGGAVLAAFGYAPLPNPVELMVSAHTDERIHRLEVLVAELSTRLNDVEAAAKA
ncbi:MAG: helix-turn-helix transcriptional regulator [Actinomycetia bacterium]|nr:helix-turn-helix transcriptional regulator [Actinomycetes bacterium]